MYSKKKQVDIVSGHIEKYTKGCGRDPMLVLWNILNVIPKKYIENKNFQVYIQSVIQKFIYTAPECIGDVWIHFTDMLVENVEPYNNEYWSVEVKNIFNGKTFLFFPNRE